MARGRGFGRGKFRKFRGGQNVENNFDYYEKTMDRIANSALTPVIFNGSLNVCGPDNYVSNHLNNFDPQLNNSNAQYMQTGGFTQMMAEPIYRNMAVEQYFLSGSQGKNADGMNIQTPAVV